MKLKMPALGLALALLGGAVNAGPATAEATYTWAQVNQHATATDCWSVVGDYVYDLTGWVNRHEGGSAVIIGMCGIDGTASFLSQHGPGSDDLDEVYQYLALYRIGTFDKSSRPDATTKYKLTQIAGHNTASDCWSIVSGGVYNLTSWVATHPGGAQVITAMCGLDGTASYLGYHQGDANPMAVLAQFQIGVLDTSEPPPVDTKYTIAQVGTHNSASDCWSAVDGKVYNLTTWINAHPGGPAVVKAMCGIDATTAYLAQHQDSASALAALAQFQIGVLDTSEPPPPAVKLKKYTIAQVKRHNAAADCWSVVSKKVYDLTDWIALHPGGAAVITAMCGKDATKAYLAQHQGEAKPTAALKPYRIGTLKATVKPKPVKLNSYTLAQVKKRSTAASCWSAVSGKVYNLTKWVALHPGGAAVITAMCGKDATKAYLAQHQGESKPAAALKPYLIGTLKKAATPPPVTGNTYTLAQVKTHNTATNCWTVVAGKVYSLTAWVKQHPGGSASIIGMCGKDATAAFKAKHGTTAAAAAALKKYLIGTLE